MKLIILLTLLISCTDNPVTVVSEGECVKEKQINGYCLIANDHDKICGFNAKFDCENYQRVSNSGGMCITDYFWNCEEELAQEYRAEDP